MRQVAGDSVACYIEVKQGILAYLIALAGRILSRHRNLSPLTVPDEPALVGLGLLVLTKVGYATRHSSVLAQGNGGSDPFAIGARQRAFICPAPVQGVLAGMHIHGHGLLSGGGGCVPALARIVPARSAGRRCHNQHELIQL